MDKFEYYPDIDDKDFNIKLWKKKEIYENKSTIREYSDDPVIKKNIVNKQCSANTLQLKNNQIFLKNYISPETIYKGVLIGSGVGTGKTCTVITITESFKDYVYQNNTKIYVIANEPVRKNAETTLYNPELEKYEKYPGSLQCTGTTYYIAPNVNESENEKINRHKQIRNNYIMFYDLDKGYNAFANRVSIMNDDEIKKTFENAVFVIDEAHNLVLSSVKKEKNEESYTEIKKDNINEPFSENDIIDNDNVILGKKTYDVLKRIFSLTNNTILILLTATPMQNDILDIILLINLLRANDHRREYTINELTLDGTNNLSFDNINTDVFSDFVKGYYSYYRGAHPSLFPLTISMKYIFREELNNNIFCEKFKKDDKPTYLYKNLDLYQCEMSYFQFYNYFKYLLIHNLIKGDNDNKLGNNKHKNFLYDKDTRDIYKLQTSIGFYPIGQTDNTVFKNNGMIQKNTTTPNNIEYKLGHYKIYNDIEPTSSPIIFNKILNKFNYPNSHFLNVNDELDLHDDGVYTSNSTYGHPLSICSSKLFTILKNCINIFGINFIFTNYVMSGTLAICLMLEQNGYIKWNHNLKLLPSGLYKGVNNYLSLRNIKYRCICGKLYDEHNKNFDVINKSDKYINDYTDINKHRFLQAVYVRLDGTTIDNLPNIMPILKSKYNTNGESIKIVVGGQNMSEGIDLKYVRAVHIVNPWHNLIQLEQTIGRGVRLCSHSLLPVNDMNVKIFRYVSIPPQHKLPSFWSINDLIDWFINYKNVSFNININMKHKLKNNFFGDIFSSDEYVYNRAIKKDLNIKKTERLLHENAVDCYINLDANINFPHDVDYSRDCNYDVCNYKCKYDMPKNVKINTDTYSVFFMQNKIYNAILTIEKIYTQVWALTLDGIYKSALKLDNTIDKYILYLAISELVGNNINNTPKTIIDKYGRDSYLIFLSPYYVLQPKEILDYFIPMYYRILPSMGIPDYLSISKFLTINKLNISNIFKNIKEDYNLDKYIDKKNENDKTNNKTTDKTKNKTNDTTNKINLNIEITANKLFYDIHNDLLQLNKNEVEAFTFLDFYDTKQINYIVWLCVTSWVNNDFGSYNHKTFEIILKYFVNNYILANTSIKYDNKGKITKLPFYNGKNNIDKNNKGKDKSKYNGKDNGKDKDNDKDNGKGKDKDNGKGNTDDVNGIWIFYFDDNFHYFDNKMENNKWVKINDDHEYLKIIYNNRPSLPKKETRKLNEYIYGFINDRDKEISYEINKYFKIYDIQKIKQNIKQKKFSNAIDKKTVSTGKKCDSFKNTDLFLYIQKLIEYAKDMNLDNKYIPNINNKSNKNNDLCRYIYIILVKLDEIDTKHLWFYNYFEYIRNFPEEKTKYSYHDKLFQFLSN